MQPARGCGAGAGVVRGAGVVGVRGRGRPLVQWGQGGHAAGGTLSLSLTLSLSHTLSLTLTRTHARQEPLYRARSTDPFRVFLLDTETTTYLTARYVTTPGTGVKRFAEPRNEVVDVCVVDRHTGERGARWWWRRRRWWSSACK